ncbi:MAG: IS982 family transposase [Chloroflexi bacterium]|nr:IS982 family transposase [Chloroflexota bacterium]
MDTNTLIVTVYCVVDDFMKSFLAGKRLRQRGPQPTLSDSETLTIEIVGEFLGLDEEKAMFGFFRSVYDDWFPALRKIDRTTFVRQAANLWKVKEKLWEHLLGQIAFDPQISLVDSFPLPICRFARAHRCRRLREIAEFGHDEVARQTFLGLRIHLQVAWPGAIVGYRLAPANVHELPVAVELLEATTGWVLGDRNYWSPEVASTARTRGLHWLTPYKSAKREKFPWPRWLTHKRYRIETVIGQMVARFNVKTIWARDAWHLVSRWLRKLLSHTISVLLCQQAGLPPLQFAKLVTL